MFVNSTNTTTSATTSTMSIANTTSSSPNNNAASTTPASTTPASTTPASSTPASSTLATSTTNSTSSSSSSSTIFNNSSTPSSISKTSSSISTQQTDASSSSTDTLSTNTSSQSQNTATSSSSENSSRNGTSQATNTSQTASQTVSHSGSSTILTVPVITVFQTTLVSSSDGSQVTAVVQVTSTIPAGSIVPAVQLQNTGNSRVRAIVGGTVGAVVGLALLMLLAFFYVRHQRQKRIEREFDGNFDPAATDKRSSHMNSIRGAAGGTLPNVGTDEELLDDGMGGRLAGTVVGGGVVSPFILPPSPGSRTSTNDPRMIEHDRASGRPISPQSTGSSSFNPYLYRTPSLTGYDEHRHRRTISGNSRTPPSSFSYPTVNVYGNVPRTTSPSSSASEYSQSQGSSKEREARGFAVANPDIVDPFAGGVTRDQVQTYLREGPSPRTAHFPHHQGAEHSHGGDELSEIPPTYDSLIRD